MLQRFRRSFGFKNSRTLELRNPANADSSWFPSSGCVRVTVAPFVAVSAAISPYQPSENVREFFRTESCCSEAVFAVSNDGQPPTSLFNEQPVERLSKVAQSCRLNSSMAFSASCGRHNATLRGGSLLIGRGEHTSYSCRYTVT